MRKMLKVVGVCTYVMGFGLIFAGLAVLTM